MNTRDVVFYSVAVLLSGALAYAIVILSPYALFAVIASLPLLIFRKRNGLIAGLAIGLFVPLSLLALYPAADIVKLGGIVSSISGLPYVAVLLLYPLVFALIMGISAVIWSEVYVRTAGRRATST